VDFFVDLSAHEQRRLAIVLRDRLDDPHFDPAAVLADEARAEALLMSGLDAEQSAIRDRLRAAGVLP
jgi:uncharacterized protein (DUF58 family)